MKRALIPAILAVLGVLTLLPSAQAAEEFRGLYVDAFHPGLLSHEQVTQMVNSAKQANFNALFVQVRKRGDTLYNSAIEPKFSGVAEGYDPLADVITQAHAAGLEVHAWMVLYEVSHTSYTLAANHVARTHEDWLLSDKEGRTTIGDGDVFTDPGVPAVQAHVVSLVREILTRYAVDGIHLENPSYPNASAGYNAVSVTAFNEEKERTGSPETTDEDWRQWRASQVTKLIRGIHDAVLELKPQVKLSASVAHYIPKDTYERSLQQWDVWMKDGLLDFVVPMLSAPGDVFARVASEAAVTAKGKHVYMGVGTYKLTAARAAEQIASLRDSDAKGVVLFNYHYLRLSDETDRAKMGDLTSVFATPATTPTMTWKQEEQ